MVARWQVRLAGLVSTLAARFAAEEKEVRRPKRVLYAPYMCLVCAICVLYVPYSLDSGSARFAAEEKEVRRSRFRKKIQSF